MLLVTGMLILYPASLWQSSYSSYSDICTLFNKYYLVVINGKHMQGADFCFESFSMMMSHRHRLTIFQKARLHYRSQIRLT